MGIIERVTSFLTKKELIDIKNSEPMQVKEKNNAVEQQIDPSVKQPTEQPAEQPIEQPIEQPNRDYCIDDTPIRIIANDAFNRRPFAERLIKVIKSRKSSECVVFGIYGKWGEGKTTVLHFVEEGLKDNPDIICIKFNPWRYSDETTMIIRFFETLSKKLEAKLSTGTEDIGGLLKKYSALVTPVSILTGTDINGVVKDVGDQLASVDVDTLKERMETILSSNNKRIVVLIDDIDRLDKTEIQTIFRLVKLMGDFKNTTYILAFDEKMVASALEEKYGSAALKLKMDVNLEDNTLPQSLAQGQKKIEINGLSDEPIAGKNFIEKIVQVPLPLPKINPLSLRKYCFDQIIDLINESDIVISQEQWVSFQKLYDNSLEIRIKNGRVAKRYTNALLFALPALNGEVNTTDLMVVEGIRILYPELYETIRENKEFFIDSSLQIFRTDEEKKKYTQLIVNDALKSYSQYEREAGIELIKALFPRLIGVFGNSTYISDSSDNRKGKRICSKDYFDRYFLYGLSENDISDKKLEEFIESLKDESIDKIFMNAQKFVQDDNISLFLIKLKDSIPQLPEKSKMNLATLMSFLGSTFSTQEDFYGISPRRRAAYLIRDLLTNTTNKDIRYEVASMILEKSPSVPFSSECYQVMVIKPEDNNSLFTSDEEKQLGDIIIKRIKGYLLEEKQPIYIKSPKEARLILYILSKYGSLDESSDYILKTFDRRSRNLKNINGTNVIEFLKCFVIDRYTADSQLPSNFELPSYESLELIVKPEIIYDDIKTLYTDLKYFDDKDNIRTFEERIVYQFIKLHEKIQKERLDAAIKKNEPSK